MSRFIVEKNIIIQACKNILEHIQAERKRLFDEKVQALLPDRKVLWFFTKKGLTVEEAEDYVKSHKDMFELWDCYAWGDKKLAESLLSACSVTESESIELCRTDAEFIAEWV